jgi:hypothetical protein
MIVLVLCHCGDFIEHKQHIIVSEKYGAKPIVYQVSTVSQCRLNILDPEAFTVPYFTTQHQLMPFGKSNRVKHHYLFFVFCIVITSSFKKCR